MEPKNHKIIRGFLSKEDRGSIVDWVDSLSLDRLPDNHHLKHIISKINGASYMFDISKTEITKKITEYQSGGAVMLDSPCESIQAIISRICEAVSIPNKNSFLQAVDMNSGGTIHSHYDASESGHINYKCNISISAEPYEFRIDDQSVLVEEGDLYCFEASLYKHWTPEKFKSRRVLLSFGFMLSYADLSRSEEDPRVRLSRRIEKYFQNK